MALKWNWIEVEGHGPKAILVDSDEEAQKIFNEMEVDDEINNPGHYNVGSISVYDFIRDQQLPYPLGNIVKYVCRCRHKGTLVKDLEKARWYLDRAIEEAEAGEWPEPTHGSGEGSETLHSSATAIDPERPEPHGDSD